MPIQRGYRDACGIAQALDLVGERWALLVVRELLLGPKRFNDLHRGLPAASPNALTDRLRELSAAGIVRKRRQPPTNTWVYELTDWGHRLEPIVISLGDWALLSPLPDADEHLSTDSLMLTVRTYYSPRTTGRSGQLEVALGDDNGGHQFGVWLQGDGVDVRHEVPPNADAVVRAPTAVGLSATFGDRAQLRSALDNGTVRIDGDKALGRHLLTSIVLPDPLPFSARR
ncbi:MAG TPA: helix-turn-helix domain-containing protein [Nocardioidaceae bacterium]|nr:helix-turn-helix domain-containing protein [Nocardioidaceae bacterium]